VPEVRVADASIVPEKKRVTILPGGLLDTLANAVVIFDTTGKKNKVYNANVIIQSKNKFVGDGIFDYQIGSLKPYPIIVHDMGVKEVKDRKKILYYTYANGSLEPDEHFMLHPKIEFKGSMSLTQDKKHPFFSGFGKLNLENTAIPTGWFAVSDEINTDTFLLHYDHPVGEDTMGARMFTGIYYSPYDSLATMYSSIMNPLHSSADLRIFDTKGILKYDDKNRKWRFGDANKINKGAVIGNVLTYDEKKNRIEAEGKVDFSLDTDPVKIKSAGTVVNAVDSGKFTFNVFLAFSIPMQKDLIEFFGTDMSASALDKPYADYSKPAFEKALAEMVDEKKAEKILEELRRTGQFLKPKDLDEYNVVLSDVKLIYEPYYQIYRSAGPLSLSFIGSKGIHKKVNGYVELGYRRNNDFFNIYFELSDSSWYFLSFSNKTLQLLSGNKNFNMLLASIVPHNRNEELANEEFYLYTATTYRKMQDFLYRMRQIEKGIKVEMVDKTEEEIFEEELDQIKKELLNYQQDTALMRQMQEQQQLEQNPPAQPQKETKKKGKKEEISFIQEEETIRQEQPDYIPASREDIEKFLNQQQDSVQHDQPLQKQPEEKSKKKKAKAEEPLPVDEEDPYADDESDEQLIAPGQEPAQQDSLDEKSDFEQITGDDKEEKKKKKKE
ncbi:MAG TPA: hypothetical protein VNJ07_08035, partial [Chitinophagales bacterium]|nr:hypothetical protein [Chitinophagales bacterium]